MTATPIPLFGDEPPAKAPTRSRRGPRVDGSDPAPTPRQLDRLLTASEAAALLGIGRSKLYELMARGDITSVKLDRCRRFRQSDVHHFISSLPINAD